MGVVRQISKAIFPVAQQDEALLFGERSQPVHGWAVEDRKGISRAIENEGKHDRTKGFVVFVELTLGRQSDIDRTELNLLRLLRRPAELVVGEDYDFDRAIGAFLDLARKLLGSDIGRMGLVGKMRKAHRDGR